MYSVYLFHGKLLIFNGTKWPLGQGTVAINQEASDWLTFMFISYSRKFIYEVCNTSSFYKWVCLQQYILVLYKFVYLTNI